MRGERGIEQLVQRQVASEKSPETMAGKDAHDQPVLTWDSVGMGLPFNLLCQESLWLMQWEKGKVEKQ